MDMFLKGIMAPAKKIDRIKLALDNSSDFNIDAKQRDIL